MKMECKTVLANNRDLAKSIIIHIDDKDTFYDASRFCSRCRSLNIIYVFFAALLAVSYVSHLLLHIQVQEIRQESDINKDKIDDLIFAQQLTFAKQTIQHSQGEPDESDPTNNRKEKRSRRTLVYSPSFSLKGANEGAIPVNGTFLWEEDIRADTTYFDVIQTMAGQIVKVKVKSAGVYRVIVKIVLFGRKPLSGSALDFSRSYPTLGLELCREEQDGMCIPEPGTNCCRLDVAYATQMKRGDEFGYGMDDYPMDTVQVEGLFFLDRGDTVFAKKAYNLEMDPHGERYFVHGKGTRFSAFLVEGEA